MSIYRPLKIQHYSFSVAIVDISEPSAPAAPTPVPSAPPEDTDQDAGDEIVLIHSNGQEGQDNSDPDGSGQDNRGMEGEEQGSDFNLTVRLPPE